MNRCVSTPLQQNRPNKPYQTEIVSTLRKKIYDILDLYEKGDVDTVNNINTLISELRNPRDGAPQSYMPFAVAKVWAAMQLARESVFAEGQKKSLSDGAKGRDENLAKKKGEVTHGEVNEALELAFQKGKATDFTVDAKTYLQDFLKVPQIEKIFKEMGIDIDALSDVLNTMRVWRVENPIDNSPTLVFHNKDNYQVAHVGLGKTSKEKYEAKPSLYLSNTFIFDFFGNEFELLNVFLLRELVALAEGGEIVAEEFEKTLCESLFNDAFMLDNYIQSRIDYFAMTQEDPSHIVYEKVSDVYEGIKNIFPEALIRPMTINKYIDTARDGDDKNRDAALHVVDGNTVEVARGMKVDQPDLQYTWGSMPLFVTVKDLPKELRKGLEGIRVPKQMKAKTIQFLQDRLAEQGIHITDKQHRSDVLPINNTDIIISCDIQSTIAVQDLEGDVPIHLAFWVKDDLHAYKAIQKLNERIVAENPLTDAEPLDPTWHEALDVSDPQKTFETVTENNWKFFHDFSKGNFDCQSESPLPRSIPRYNPA